MLKPTKQQRKQVRLLYQNIPEGGYCEDCQHKRYTPLKTDYYIHKGIINVKEYINSETLIKIKRRRVYCKLNKRRSYNDLRMPEGIKWRGRNWCN